VARWAPLSPAFRPTRVRLRTLEYPTISELAPGFVLAVSRLQTELRMYELLSPSQRKAVTGPGLTLSWAEMGPEVRRLFERRIRLYVQPDLSEQKLRRSSVFLQFAGDRLHVHWTFDGTLSWWHYDESLAVRPSTEPQSLVGSRAREIECMDASGKVVRLPLIGPLFLYVAPAWPRPIVARTEEFADLKALQLMRGDGSGTRILVVGTDATTSELRSRWQERDLSLPPLALTPDSAQRFGVRHLPLAIVLDRKGRIMWAREGYAKGDEAEWRRELERVRE
jgi:hypothetical protein